MTRSRTLVLALTSAATAAALVLGAGAADAAVKTYTKSATATVTKSNSYTATASQPVSATASWGLPAITQTLTNTVNASATSSATKTASVTATATGTSAAAALAAAQLSAKISATTQAQISSLTTASVNAGVAAHTKLVTAIIAAQTALYNQALAAVQAAVTARSASNPASTTPDAPVTNCGTTIYKADGTPWTCTFDDEFTGTTLDTTKWTAWNNVNWWADSTMCYDSDPSHMAVSGGTLNLTVTRNTTGETCKTPYGLTTPTYQGAVVTSQAKFSQQYGRFEARIQYAGGYGIHNNFWLYSDSSGAANTAEIDVAESWGAKADEMIGATHVAAPDGSDAGDWKACGMPNWSAGYHTYAVEWTPQTVTFIYDDNACTSWSIPRSSFANGAAFDQKLFMILQTLADDGTYSPAPTAATVMPSSTKVDWVRVWK